MAKIASQSQSKSVSKKASAKESGVGVDLHSQIASMAYQFYVDRGYQDGFDREDWLRAESIVRAQNN